MMLYVFIAGACLAAAVTAVRPRWGLILTIVAAPAYLLKTTIAGVPVAILEALILGTFIGWLVGFFAKKRPDVRTITQTVRVSLPVTIVFPMVLAAFGWLLATYTSIDVRASLGAMKAWLVGPALFGLMVLVEVRRDGRTGPAIVRALLVLVAWVSLAGIAQLVWFRDTLQDARLSSVFAPVANYFAMFAAPLFVFAVGFVTVNRERMLATVAAALSGIALLFSLSYGGFLAVCAGGLVLIVTLLQGKTRRRTLAYLGAAVAIGFIALIPTRQFKEKLNFTTRSSSLVRTEIWRTAIEIGTQHPFSGVGPNTFEAEYRKVAPTLYHPPLEWLVAKPHNLYLNAWVETGMLGLIGLVWFMVSVLRLLFLRKDGDAVGATIVGASLVAVLVHGLVDTPLFKNDLALIAAVMLAYGLAIAARSARPVAKN